MGAGGFLLLFGLLAFGFVTALVLACINAGQDIADELAKGFADSDEYLVSILNGNGGAPARRSGGDGAEQGGRPVTDVVALHSRVNRT